MFQRYKLVGIITFTLCVLSACNQNSTPTAPEASKKEPSNTTPILHRRSEGYPLWVIKAHNDYDTKIRTDRPMSFQSVISATRTWPSSKTVTVAFQGGSKDLRTEIAQAVTPWTDHANLKLDFDEAHGFREWKTSDKTYKADIRIAFQSGNDGGYWSLVGQDSINPSIAKPNQASMNFEGFTDGVPPDGKSVILHEFGHALGFDHEHQNPTSNCDAEFRWEDDPNYVKTQDSYQQLIPDSAGRRPGIYTRLEGPLNKWSPEQIDFNLRKLPFTPDLLATALDSKSIMMYHFDDWMFVEGKNSSCYTDENLLLSQGDIQAAESVYPHGLSATKSTKSTQIDALKEMLNSPGLTGDVRAHYTRQLNSLVQSKATKP